MRICCWMRSRRGPNNLEKSWDEMAKHFVGLVEVTVAWRGSSSMRACVLWEVTASRRRRGTYHLAKIIPPLQREQVLLLRTISFGAFYFAIFYQIKVVARLALGHYFTAGGELDALQGVGDPLQST